MVGLIVISNVQNGRAASGGGGGDACIVACTLDGSTVATFIIAYMYKIGVLVAILVV